MLRLTAADALLREGVRSKTIAAEEMGKHSAAIGTDPGADSEATLAECAACAAAHAPGPACAKGSSMLASVVPGFEEVEPKCEFSSEKFPVLHIGDERPAVSVAQFDLNFFSFQNFSNV